GGNSIEFAWILGEMNNPSSAEISPKTATIQSALSDLVTSTTGKESTNAIHGPRIGTISPRKAITHNANHISMPTAQYAAAVISPTTTELMITPRVYAAMMPSAIAATANVSSTQRSGISFRISRCALGRSINT